MIDADIITGAEAPIGDGSALDALTAFYRAFNSGDLDALSRNWMAGDAPSMNNPIGGIRRGWSSIHEGYERLFKGSANVRVEFYDFTQHSGADWCLFAGRERGTCITPTAHLRLRIRTTRWFVRSEGAWRQLHHHGSIEEPELLADYQRAIFGKSLGDDA